MARFNPAAYNPAKDSSPGTPANTKVLVINLADEFVCRCGCGDKPKNPKRRFVQGHDARLKGALIRAAITGTKVAIVQGKDRAEVTAQAAAKSFGFADQVARSKSIFDDHAKARKEAAAKKAADRKKADAKAKEVAAKKASVEKASAARKAGAAKKATKATKGSARKAPAKQPTPTPAPGEGAVVEPTPEEGLTGIGA